MANHCRLAPFGRPVCALRSDWSSPGWLLSVDVAFFSGWARGFPCCWSVSLGAVGRLQLESSPAPMAMVSKSVRMHNWTRAYHSHLVKSGPDPRTICGYSGVLHFVRSESDRRGTEWQKHTGDIRNRDRPGRWLQSPRKENGGGGRGASKKSASVGSKKPSTTTK
jgi:hypothetical protein